MPRVKTNLICFFFVFAMAGCVRPASVSTANIDPLGWSTRDTVRLEVINKDTLSQRSIGILFRFDNTFPDSELSLTVRVSTPDSLWYEENFTARLGSPVRANNDYYEATAPYRHGVVLMREGAYIFEILNTGGEVRGLWGAGMIIE